MRPCVLISSSPAAATLLSHRQILQAQVDAERPEQEKRLSTSWTLSIPPLVPVSAYATATASDRYCSARPPASSLYSVWWAATSHCQMPQNKSFLPLYSLDERATREGHVLLRAVEAMRVWGPSHHLYFPTSCFPTEYKLERHPSIQCSVTFLLHNVSTRAMLAFT